MVSFRGVVVAFVVLAGCRSTRPPAPAPAQPGDTVPAPAAADGRGEEAGTAGASWDAAAVEAVAEGGGEGEPAPVSPRVRVTEAVDAACGPDYFLRQPAALADLDRDGALERASVVREGRELVVRLYRLPGLVKAGEWRIPGDSVEVGATRCKDRTAGDLWIHAGVAHDPRGESWSHTLYHLEGGGLKAVAEDIVQSNLFFDLDGDGCIDPIVSDAEGGRVLRGGSWSRLPEGFEPMRLFGLPFGHSQQEAVDLDADGDLDLGMVDPTAVKLVDAKTLETVWSRPGYVWNAHLVRWGERILLVANIGETLEIIGVDAEHAVLLSFASESYQDPIPGLDAAGDGSVLALHSLLTQLLEPGATGPVDLGVTLAGALDDTSPQLGPVLLDGDDAPDLLGVRVLDAGHPMIAFHGSEAKYELVLLPPPGKGDGRVIWQAAVNGALSAEAWVVDLEGDRKYEIVLDESAGYSSCDRTSSGSVSTLYLLDGEGGVLWQDVERSEYFGEGRPPDLEAHARAMDLWGDQRRAVRVRAAGKEWYLLPAGAEASGPIPACLE
ncbi:MAG: hypothetical protein HY907_03105 [Deltaproteobacteria bacterium]|nr:hypothetical protein [Deltaproteobacteria bacterium]